MSVDNEIRRKERELYLEWRRLPDAEREELIALMEPPELRLLLAVVLRQAGQSD